MVSPRLYNGTKAGKMVHSNLHNRPQFIRKKREQYPFGSYTSSNVCWRVYSTVLYILWAVFCKAPDAEVSADVVRKGKQPE